MKRKIVQRVLCFVLAFTLLLGALGITTSAASLKYNPNDEHPYVPTTLEEMQSVVTTSTYEEYLRDYGHLGKDGLSTIPVDILEFDGNGFKVSESELCQDSMVDNEESWKNFDPNGEGLADKSVYLPAKGSVTWRVTLDEEQAGLYYIKLEYYSVNTAESSISSIERKFFIDGKVPFNEVTTIALNKNWRYDYDIVSEVTTVADKDEYSYNVSYNDKNDDNAYYKIVTLVQNGEKKVTTYKITQDINGNSMAPSAVSVSQWNTHYLQSYSAYLDNKTNVYDTGYYKFYIADGTRELTFQAEREPVIIKSIELVPVDESSDILTYEEVLKMYREEGYTAPSGGGSVRIEAEFPDLISDSSVAATNDNTSAINYPISHSAQIFNVIGENSYSAEGQWAAYKFQVNETGLYNFAMRYKQSALEGMYICRTIKIHGGIYGLEDGTPTVPFIEAYNTEFDYSKKWQSEFLSDGGDPFMFYFEKGVEYTVYFECSLGTLKEYINRVEVALNNINGYYLRVLQYTGADPDPDRDYKFEEVMPDVLYGLLEMAVELDDVKNDLEELCGTNGSHIATLETVAILLDDMGEKHGLNLASNMSTLKSYLGTLGSWINSSKRSSMTVDSIWVVPTDEASANVAMSNSDKLPEAKAGFWKSLWFEVKSFFASFFTEYDQMGLTKIPDENTTTVDVWLATGRDQSQIWRKMIDAHDSYTESTGNAVTLKLVTAGTLLPSILSGKGPDVYLGLSSADVINYAVRDAVVGISGNYHGFSESENEVFSTTYYTYMYGTGEDAEYETTTEYKGEDNLSFTTLPFEQVINGVKGDDPNFSQAAMDTVTLLDVAYGVPETMTFAMMFYRMDVLAELGQEIPETWTELLSILPALQSNNMDVGVAYINALDFMIYQMGGNLWEYTDTSLYDSRYAGAKIALDSEVSKEAFAFTCRLYSDYSFPISYDAANRFRTGEMPIVIGDYISIYNQLVVYATEIEGLWSFCSLPGVEREDGTVNYDSLAGIGATVILHGCDDLLAAWQFTQWQTGAEAQAEYGNGMVALIGPSAKYQTANLNAIDNLSWTASEKEAILNQMDNMSSIVNYPGSYIITRYVQFAFLDVQNENADPVEALTGYIDAINSEITRKREEFCDPESGLDIWYEGKPDDVEVPPQKQIAKRG